MEEIKKENNITQDESRPVYKKPEMKKHDPIKIVQGSWPSLYYTYYYYYYY